MALGGIIVGYIACAALCAYLHMRLTDEDDPGAALMWSWLWPLVIPFVLIFAAAKLGERK